MMNTQSLNVKDIAEMLKTDGLQVALQGPPDMRVDHLRNIELADDHCLTFYVGNDPVDLAHLKGCAVLCLPGVEPASSTVTRILTDDPRLAFYIAAQAFVSAPPAPAIHPTAIIHPEANVHPTASIGPYVVLEKCEVGENAVIQSHVRIGDRCRIGKNVTIESGTCLGATGQIWAWGKDGQKTVMPQFGAVTIGDDCFIGANNTFSRGALQDTIVERGCRFSHGSVFGHNCFIGEETFVSNGVAVPGSVSIGRCCFLGANSSYRPGVVLGDHIIVGVGSAVVSDFRDAHVVLAGVPARVIKTVVPGSKLAGVPQNPVIGR